MSSTPPSQYQLGVSEGRTQASLESIAGSIDDILIVLRGENGRGGVVGDVQSLTEWRHSLGMWAKGVGAIFTSSAFVGAILKMIGVV